MTDQKFTPMSAAELTPELKAEALHTAIRYDRNLANKDGTEAFPVPCRTARLMALLIINQDAEIKRLEKVLAKPAAPPKGKKLDGAIKVGKALPTEAEKLAAAKAKADAKKIGNLKADKPAVAEALKKPPTPIAGPPLTEERTKAFEVCKALVAAKKVITARAVAEGGEWKSHNTGARHLNSLIDLGYLKRVGKSKTIALTGLEP